MLTSINISVNFNIIKHLRWSIGAKQIYPKKQKKILTKDTVRISEAVVWNGSAKKVSLKSLKVLPPVYLHIKIDMK